MTQGAKAVPLDHLQCLQQGYPHWFGIVPGLVTAMGMIQHRNDHKS